ncbi:protein misato isoform X1 [Neodiprion pinetum]|uniref:protein misato isoform X1 n=1 Tax=Neodiprion pinetum TaxID=441929 RepID=UPI001EDCC30E|nr:protein misato isoform X1 [Neodiprion pinetum]
MPTREVLTLQFGHYSNFIGTHWWNIQESSFSYEPKQPSEINHDVLYREGETPRKETTFTPRLLLVDLKGSVGHLTEQGNLYNAVEKSLPLHSDLWDSENIQVTTEPVVNKAPFIQNLEKGPADGEDAVVNFEDDVTVWADYLVPRFHPRTVNIVREYEHQSLDQPFNVFHYGHHLWKTEQFQEEFSNKIRAYAEECDFMQGFQVILDSTNGFSGLGSSCIQHLQDEYGKSILAFPVIDGKNFNKSLNDLFKVLNTALCYQSIGEHCSLFSPLCVGQNGWPQAGACRQFNHLTYNSELDYHTSSLLATALDTISLRYRQKEFSTSALSDLCADLNKLGRRAAATSLSLPFPMTAGQDLIDVLDDHEGPLWTSLTPSCDISMDKSMQSLVLRGIHHERLKRPPHEAKLQQRKAAYSCSSVHEMMTLYLACSCHATATHLTNLKAPLTIKEPYPNIFNNNIHQNGDLSPWPVGEEVKSVPVLAGLHSGPGLSHMFDSLHSQASRIKSISKLRGFKDSGLEQDELIECLDQLLTYKEAYEDHYE